jgi:flagellar motor switch protein FliM
MSKKLTQEQIEELFSGGLEALNSMEMKKGKGDYQEYDFDRPDKFNMDNLNSLKSISSVFARNFSQLISASLGGFAIKFQYDSIDQIPYSAEYVEKIPKNQYVFVVVDLGNAELGKIILEFDLNVVIPIHKKLLGGKVVEIEEERRQLTEIEVISMSEWIREMLFTQLQESFKNVVAMDLSVSTVETEAQYAKITSPTDMIAYISFNVFINDRKSTMRICIPFNSVENIIDKLTTENVFEQYKYEETEEQTHIIKKQLELIPQTIEVELGQAEITIRELMEYEEGDFMILNKKTNEDLIGYISGLPKFSCQMGRQGNKIAVKVTGFSKSEEWEDRFVETNPEYSENDDI